MTLPFVSPSMRAFPGEETKNKFPDASKFGKFRAEQSEFRAYSGRSGPSDPHPDDYPRGSSSHLGTCIPLLPRAGISGSCYGPEYLNRS